jgi:hypothetical protein
MNERPSPTLAERLGNPGVSSQVQSRIVAGTMARLQAPPRTSRWLLATAGLGATIAAGVLLLAHRPPPAPMVTSAPRPVLTPHAAPPIAATEALPPRAFVGPHGEDLGRHRLTLAAGGRAEWLPSPAGEVTVRLDQGHAQFDVAHLEKMESFRVLSEPVEVTVVGTRFRVDRQGGCTAVALQEGQVDVSFRGQVVAHLHPSDERTFCLTAAGLESTSPGEKEVRAALALIARDRELGRAAELLERYQRNHPGGVFEAEALFHLVRLQVRLDRRARAGELLDELQRRHAGDPRLPALHDLLDRR